MTIQKTLRRNTAFILFVVGIFLVAGISAYLYAIETETIQSQTNRVADEAAESVKDATRMLFRDLRTITELGRYTTSIGHESSTRSIDAFIQHLGTQFIDVGYLDPSNKYHYAISQNPSLLATTDPHLVDARDRLLQKILNSGVYTVSEPLDLANGESALIFAAPIISNKQTTGMAYGVIPVSFFYDALNTICSKTGYHFSILLPFGSISQLPGGRCIVQSTQTTTQSLPWLQTIRAIRVADGTWEIPVSRPTFRFRLTDIGSVVPFAVGGVLVVSMISFLVFRIEKNRELLEQAIARENEFVSIVSHQLREPVSQMNAIIELLEDSWPEAAEKKSRELVEDLHTINHANARLISNLLNISRLQRGVLKVSTQRIVIKDLLETALKKTDASREAQRIRVRVKPLNMSRLVNVDENLAGEVIQIILDNAYKYSPAGSEVSIKVDAAARSPFIVLSISDQGPGIPPALQKTLFLKEKGKAAKTSSTGAGLGLFITNKFMTLMGGDIRFKTSSKGTTFFLSFPKGNA